MRSKIFETRCPPTPPDGGYGRIRIDVASFFFGPITHETQHAASLHLFIDLSTFFKISLAI